MAQDNSNKRSRKSSKRTKRRQNTDQNGATYTNKKERINTLPRLDNETVERVPSNAPTMAIAPSDYEHIFHEGPVSPETRHEATPPPQKSPPPTPTIPRLTVQQPRSPIYQPPQAPISPPQQRAYQNTHLPEADGYNQDSYGERQNVGAAYPPEVLVTPDGYTFLGHAPSSRKIPLPPHIVRASNQFSRAALARVARYLASRAEPQFR